MKFQDFASLQRSLEVLLPPVLLVLLPQDFERQTIIEQILHLYQKKALFQRIKFSSEEVQKAITALCSRSLFAEDPFVIIDEVHTIKKREEELLLRYLAQPAPKSCLLLGAKEKKGISFLREIDAKGVVLDLGFERIKDREKRFLDKLLSKLALSKKTMEKQAIEQFFAKIGLDFAALENESEKLLCFVGEKERIVAEDVALICSSSDRRNLWEMAEDFVWKQRSLPPVDSSLFHSLICALRYQLQLGLKWNFPEKNESSSFFYKKEEEKRRIALQLGAGFFKKQLLLLFEIDLLSKTNTNSYDALFSYLQSKMLLECS
jgi:DNA polymerase III delta subunit